MSTGRKTGSASGRSSGPGTAGRKTKHCNVISLLPPQVRLVAQGILSVQLKETSLTRTGKSNGNGNTIQHSSNKGTTYENDIVQTNILKTEVWLLTGVESSWLSEDRSLRLISDATAASTGHALPCAESTARKNLRRSLEMKRRGVL